MFGRRPSEMADLGTGTAVLQNWSAREVLFRGCGGVHRCESGRAEFEPCAVDLICLFNQERVL